jgi:predicted PurR-regulated permease PerM
MEQQAVSESRIPGKQIRLSLTIAAVAIGLYLSHLLAYPFQSSLIWALVLSVIITPLHRRVEARIRPPSLASLASVTAVAIALVVPAALVGQQLVREVANGAVYLAGAFRNMEWREAIAASPRLSAIVAWVEDQVNLAGIVGSLATRLSTMSTSFLRGSINQVINLVLTFYFLFYFLRDRQKTLHALRNLSPLSDAETEQIACRFVDTVHATMFGTVAVAAVQGTLGGLMFWWLGLPTPVFWGVVMGLLAVVPMLGAFVVWVPASIALALDGQWTNALILAGWGGLIIATIDNLLYPVLVGNRLKLHTLVTFVGAVGGVILFGAYGIVLGPAIVVVTGTLIELLRRRFVDEAATLSDAATPGEADRKNDQGEWN